MRTSLTRLRVATANLVDAAIIRAAAREISAKTLRMPSEVALEYLRKLNVEPQYLRQNIPEFATMRQRLNSEPGLVIANHPGVVDTALILSMIHRNDLKVLI